MAVREYRFTTGELRHRVAGDTGHIEGLAVRFDTFSQNLGGFVESVAKGAAVDSIAQKSQSKRNDIRGMYNHGRLGSGVVLARQANGTLRVSENEDGIAYEIDMNLRDSRARDVFESIDRGDVTQSSFGFRALPEGVTWGLTEAGFPHRRIDSMELFDVGPADMPAYLDATVDKRSIHLRSFLASHGHDFVPVLRDDEDPTDFLAYLAEIEKRTTATAEAGTKVTVVDDNGHPYEVTSGVVGEATRTVTKTITKPEGADAGPVEATPRLAVAQRRLQLLRTRAR